MHVYVMSIITRGQHPPCVMSLSSCMCVVVTSVPVTSLSIVLSALQPQ